MRNHDDCAAGSGADEIRLAAGDYVVTAVDNFWYGPNGLPAITSDVTIAGDAGGSRICRGATMCGDAPDATKFRLSSCRARSSRRRPSGA